MTNLHAHIRLRPIRIGFLVRPTDMASILKIMRINACLWGGMYNPIIPVFRNTPAEWRHDKHDQVTGLDIAKGYIKFFEPDVFVEAKSGLLEEVGLGALREKYSTDKQILLLKDFLKPEYNRDYSEPAFGLSAYDILSDIYKKEKRFNLRDDRDAAWIKSDRASGITEALFGFYPKQKDVAYIPEGYRGVFKPNEMPPSPEAWEKVFLKGAETPLNITNYELNIPRSWNDNLVIYVFNPQKTLDLIDLWNLRSETKPVLPVPIRWFEALADKLSAIIAREYSPVKGNPSGLMHHATVEFSRSIKDADSETLLKHLTNLPKGSLSVKKWRTPVWVDHVDREFVFRERRIEITHKEHRKSSLINEERNQKNRELTASFEFLEPEFAEQYGGLNDRWVNVLKISSYSAAEKIATVYPYNTFDRSWPPLGLGGDRISIGSEGWAFGEKYKNTDKTIWLQTREEAVIGSLKQKGIEAKLSEPGYIAQQMLVHLGGLWGVHLLKDLQTIELLNDMAGAVRRKVNASNAVEENFEKRSAPIKRWFDLVERRKQSRSLPKLSVSDFTSRNVIRLGLETVCTHCQNKNWHSLTSANYSLDCERCLKVYDFPQAELRKENKNWHYRVVGPFSVPDYGRGSYSALLSLKAIKELSGSSTDDMTYSTALNLSFDDVEAEADFIAWKRKGQLDSHEKPILFIGESKSIGKGDLIKQKDIKKLKHIGKKLPGAVLVVSVLRDHFTKNEIKILKKFVQWGRREDAQKQPTNPIILLTSNELFCRFSILDTWKSLDPHKNFSDFYYGRTIPIFADATQQIYLGMQSVYEDRAAKWKKKQQRKSIKKETSSKVSKVGGKGEKDTKRAT